MYCPNHDDQQRLVTKSIGVCSKCILESINHSAEQTHESLRLNDRLVPTIPLDGDIVCPDCGNHCKLTEGQTGYCNLRIRKGNKVVERFPGNAVVSWYFDSLPTNCVADWACSVTKKYELGSGRQRLKNLAIFYGSCNSDCLFCQNASYRSMMARGSPLMTPQELADTADDYTMCVCYFGGDPSPNAEHSVKTSQLLAENRDVIVCYETNGNISSKWLTEIANIIEQTKGTFKFDLKAYSSKIYEALTGVSNGVVLRNFENLASSKKDRDGEFLVASILLVPGYIDVPEISKLSKFIAHCDPTIPTAFLGFAPHHAMRDLPRTSLAHAKAAIEAAKEQGLENVRIGNLGLLSHADYRYD